MAERLRLEETFRRAIEANVRYYEALGQATADYVKALVDVLRDLPLTIRAGTEPRPGAPPPSAARFPAMVLEAEAGGHALGVFLVENKLDRKVSAPIVASAFVAPDGREVHPVLGFDPEVVTLDPGEQILVRVTAAIDEQLESGVTYRGEVTVPGLSGSRVPLVVRCRPGFPSPAPGAARGAAARGPAAKRRSPRRKPSPAPRRSAT